MNISYGDISSYLFPIIPQCSQNITLVILTFFTFYLFGVYVGGKRMKV